MVATAVYSVTMVLWKETAFPLCRATLLLNIISIIAVVVVVTVVINATNKVVFLHPFVCFWFISLLKKLCVDFVKFSVMISLGTLKCD